jgi:hypothetical protein
MPEPVPGVHGPIPGIMVGQGIGVPLPGIIVGHGMGGPMPGIVVGHGIGAPMPGVPCAPVAPEEADPSTPPPTLSVVPRTPLHAASRMTNIPTRPRSVQCCLRWRIPLTIF